VEWAGLFTGSATHVASNNSQITLLTAAQLSEYIHPTLVRVRGIMHLKAYGTIVATGTAFVPNVVLGIAVVTEQAAAALATPIADTNLDADWLYWDSFTFGGGARGADTVFMAERIIDSKAMRRINQPDNARVIMSVSINFDGGAGTIRENIIMRLLIKGD